MCRPPSPRQTCGAGEPFHSDPDPACGKRVVADLAHHTYKPQVSLSARKELLVDHDEIRGIYREIKSIYDISDASWASQHFGPCVLGSHCCCMLRATPAPPWREHPSTPPLIFFARSTAIEQMGGRGGGINFVASCGKIDLMKLCHNSRSGSKPSFVRSTVDQTRRCQTFCCRNLYEPFPDPGVSYQKHVGCGLVKTVYVVRARQRVRLYSIVLPARRSGINQVQQTSIRYPTIFSTSPGAAWCGR